MTHMYRALMALWFLCSADVAYAAPAAVEHVVDGDTLYVTMDGRTVKVRLAHVDTPEVGVNAKCARERERGDAASAFAKSLMPIGTTVDVQPTGKTERWGRLLADVRIGRLDLGAELLRRGLAAPYDGRTKPDWCR